MRFHLGNLKDKFMAYLWKITDESFPPVSTEVSRVIDPARQAAVDAMLPTLVNDEPEPFRSTLRSAIRRTLLDRGMDGVPVAEIDSSRVEIRQVRSELPTAQMLLPHHGLYYVTFRFTGSNSWVLYTIDPNGELYHPTGIWEQDSGFMRLLHDNRITIHSEEDIRRLSRLYGELRDTYFYLYPTPGPQPLSRITSYRISETRWETQHDWALDTEFRFIDGKPEFYRSIYCITLNTDKTIACAIPIARFQPRGRMGC